MTSLNTRVVIPAFNSLSYISSIIFHLISTSTFLKLPYLWVWIGIVPTPCSLAGKGWFLGVLGYIPKLQNVPSDQYKDYGSMV